MNCYTYITFINLSDAFSKSQRVKNFNPNKKGLSKVQMGYIFRVELSAHNEDLLPKLHTYWRYSHLRCNDRLKRYSDVTHKGWRLPKTETCLKLTYTLFSPWN